MNVGKGGTPHAIETPNGYRITPFDPDFAAKMEKADDIVRRYRGTLVTLSE